MSIAVRSLRLSIVFPILLGLTMLFFALAGTPAAAQETTVTVVTNAPGNPDEIFEYWFSDSSGVVTVEQRHGESTTLTISPGDNGGSLSRLSGQVGFTDDVTCTDDEGGAQVPGLIRDVELALAPGTQAICTYSHDFLGSANLTIAFESNVPGALMNLPCCTLQAGESRTLPFLATSPFDLDIFFLVGTDPTPGSCDGDDGALIVERNRLRGTLPAGAEVTCTFGAVAAPTEIYPTVTCLAGNGRIDVNMVNTDSTTAAYRVEVGELPARRRVVAANDWWRSPVTGRPDGPISVRVFREVGPYRLTLLDTTVTVACDIEPQVSSPEIQIINICRGGNGFIAWQFANPTSATRSYVIGFEGLSNRSTSAAALGAAVRGVSGRPDGTYEYSVRINGVLDTVGSVTVDCD